MTNTLDYAVPPSPAKHRWMIWTGRVLSALPVLMLGGGGIYAAFHPEMMKEGMAQQRWPASMQYVVLTLEIACALIYAIPQTAVLGAVLLTGYFGGAIASHLRAGEPPMAIPAIVFGILTWLGLFLRDARVRALLPWRWL